jgi:Trk-type K+ transport system membrane component
MKSLLRIFGCTRNLLIVVGIICEFVMIFTLVKVQAQEPNDSTAKLVSALREFSKSDTINQAVCMIETGEEVITKSVKAQRSMAKLIGTIGIILFMIAWKAHKEAWQHASAQLSPAAETTKDSEPTQS